jgi:hypothetical protein
MVFDQLRNEIKELLALVRLDEQYCAAVTSGAVVPDAKTVEDHARRSARIAELSSRYGLD